MKKVTIAIGVVLLLAFAVPAMAQGPFADVPTDHWAYPAVNDLQQRGVLIGYPDGTFQGRRAITRYEFAVAIARMIGILDVPPGVAPPGVTPAELEALRRRVEALEARVPPEVPPPAVTREEFQALQRLVNEFRDELAALGVDVDALRRDMASLMERMSAVEAELERVRWSGDFSVFGIATNHDTGVVFDRDNRSIAVTDEWWNTIGAVYDGDLNISGRLTETAVANAMLNFGNYLNYIGWVDDFIGGERAAANIGDGVFPYYLNLDMGFGMGDFQVGRLPLQFTPFTLKKIDVDTYTSIHKTDSGDYPIDGAKMTWRLGGVALTGYAAKHNSNELLRHGLTSQASGGLYTAPLTGRFHEAGGAGAGGLDAIDQSAGVRAVIGTPLAGNLGLTYMRIGGATTLGGGTHAGEVFDQADVMGADVSLNWNRLNVDAEYAQTTTFNAGAGGNITNLNKAFDGKIGTTFGGFGLGVGWKVVEINFAAPGYWERIGRWANPTNIKGPYLNASYGLTGNVRLVADGALYKGANDVGGVAPAINNEDDEIMRGAIGLKWGLSPAWTVDAGVEQVRWTPNGADRTNETYWTIGAAWQINPSAGLKLAYQIVDYSAGATGPHPYGDADYKGNLAVAEFGVRF